MGGGLGTLARARMIIQADQCPKYTALSMTISVLLVLQVDVDEAALPNVTFVTDVRAVKIRHVYNSTVSLLQSRKRFDAQR